MFVPDKFATAALASIALVITPFAIAVAFPIDVTGPVRLAFVVTEPAVVADVAFPVKAPTKVGAVTVPVKVGEATGAFSVSSSLIADWTVVAEIFPEVTFATVAAVWSPVFVPDKFPTAELAIIPLVIAPVPMEVAFPTEVTGPVKLAFVVTVVAVAAFPPMLRLATGVVEVTVNGATPVATVDTTTGALKFPVVVRLVPVAAPIFGVTKFGEFAKTARPVPVSSDNAPAKPAEFVNVFCLPAAEVVTAASA